MKVSIIKHRPEVNRQNFIGGVRHVLEGGQWYMQYMARYGKYKFYNFESNEPNYKCPIMPNEKNWMPTGNSNC